MKTQENETREPNDVIINGTGNPNSTNFKCYFNKAEFKFSHGKMLTPFC